MKDFFMFKYSREESKLPGVDVFTPDPYTDYRGTMWTHWENSMDTPQSKISKFTRSRKNVLRGLHGDTETWKHITCVYGAFYLVVVDYREDSINYLNSVTFTLDDRNMKSVLVPPGYLNGHLCLSNECVFHYTQSYPNDYVDSQDQISVKWNDKDLNIIWPIDNPILYGRDK
jgi:dTDP-4-dehydrorhamnose 3,5-epimerase